jgi:hypothetical protein
LIHKSEKENTVNDLVERLYSSDNYEQKIIKKSKQLALIDWISKTKKI